MLTWPEGNGFLVQQLEQQASAPIQSKLLIFEVTKNRSGVQIHGYDVSRNETVLIQAQKVLLATPQFISRKLLNLPASPDFHYAPWLVANLTVSGLPQNRGMPLCWDNVIYGGSSVGYVTATHQHLNASDPKVITVYWPLVQEPPDRARQNAFQTPYESWLQQILAELEKAHPGVSEYVTTADCWVWGHGMIAPKPGFIGGESRRKAAEPIDNTIFFAHSDLSGISLFEEAFYQGIRAAREILGQKPPV
ncbi:hypothetical protein GCM10027299_23290 [Larkinella ripae]